MLQFIFTYSESTSRGGYTRKTVRLYRIKSNKVHFIGDLTENFVSEFQLVMMCAEKYKALPKSAFVENPNTGGYKYCNNWLISQAGIANFEKV